MPSTGCSQIFKPTPSICCRAFDTNREQIYAIAAKVYARGRRGSYELNAADV